MHYSLVLFAGLSCSVLSPVLGSYDGGYIPTHDLDHDDDYFDPSYHAPSIDHHHTPHAHGHSAGSYYHYHVPLVGQQHHQPSYHQDHSHYLWPLLLLLALPLLFLPLLPLLLLPLGISLLALLAPAGMMMMMMMMMMGGEMMMRRSEPLSGRALNEIRTFGDVVLNDMTSLLSKYARSLDLDQCPQRVACEVGAMYFFENNSTGPSTAQSLASMMIDQYIPKGKVKRTIRRFEKAFFTGSSKAGGCGAFQCQPSLKIYMEHWGGNGEDSSKRQQIKIPSGSPSSSTVTHFNGSSRVEAPDLRTKHVNYVYPSSGNKDTVSDLLDQDLQSVQSEGKVKAKRSNYSSHFHLPYGKYKVGDIKIPYVTSGGSQDRKTTLYKMFGTPIVKS